MPYFTDDPSSGKSLFHPDALIHIKSADNPTGPLVFDSTPFKSATQTVADQLGITAKEYLDAQEYGKAQGLHEVKIVKLDAISATTITETEPFFPVDFQTVTVPIIQPAPAEYDDRPAHFRVWDLPVDLNLTEMAADFYLLYDLNHRGIDDGEFDKYVSENVGYFYRYSDMIIGGELRHAPGNVDKNRVSQLARPLWEKIRHSYYDAPIVDGHYGYTFHNGRHDAWLAWHTYRAKVGTPALRQAMSVFSSFGASHGRSSFGGAKWANIAKIVWNYERGKMSAIMFMDYVWGLEHNYGSFFNKITWGYSSLKTVLNANLDADLFTVYIRASSAVQNLYKEKLRCH